MKPSELVRCIKRLAARRGWEVEVVEGAKHTKVRLNGQSTVVPRHVRDMKARTFDGIMKQLDLTPHDLED